MRGAHGERGRVVDRAKQGRDSEAPEGRDLPSKDAEGVGRKEAKKERECSNKKGKPEKPDPRMKKITFFFTKEAACEDGVGGAGECHV